MGFTYEVVGGWGFTYEVVGGWGFTYEVVGRWGFTYEVVGGWDFTYKVVGEWASLIRDVHQTFAEKKDQLSLVPRLLVGRERKSLVSTVHACVYIPC